jgi:hypothetical protein
MSVRAVCGGELPANGEACDADTRAWAERNKCLFTVVDGEDEPKMVVEFAPDFSSYIEVDQLERQSRLPPLLKFCGVQYLTISGNELHEILDPRSSLDLIAWLKDRFGIDDGLDDSSQEGS